MSDTREASTSHLVHSAIASNVARLQHGYLADQPAAVASLARIRRNDLTDPGANPDTLGELFDGLPEPLMSTGYRATPAERAVHAAITLYAVHQQGRKVPMHEHQGSSFGWAVRELSSKRRGAGDGLDPGVLSRFQRAISANSEAMRLFHLKALITMMRAEQVAFDYGRFGRDLFQMGTAQGRNRIALAWSRDLYRRPKKNDSETRTNDAPTTTTSEEH